MTAINYHHLAMCSAADVTVRIIDDKMVEFSCLHLFERDREMMLRNDMEPAPSTVRRYMLLEDAVRWLRRIERRYLSDLTERRSVIMGFNDFRDGMMPWIFRDPRAMVAEVLMICGGPIEAYDEGEMDIVADWLEENGWHWLAEQARPAAVAE